MPNVSSAKQPLKGACWKKVAISYEMAGVALYFLPPRHKETHSLDRANSFTFNKPLSFTQPRERERNTTTEKEGDGVFSSTL